MMIEKLFSIVFLTILIAKSANCINESEFETRKNQFNLIVLFVKDVQFGEFNHFFSQVKDLYDKDPTSTTKYDKIDCVDNAKLCETQNITELMELKYFAKDNTDNKKFIDFIENKVQEALTSYRAEEAAKAQLSNGGSFVKFFSKDCPMCKQIEKYWIQLEEKYNNSGIKIFNVNCIETRMVCKKFKILKYPTLIYIQNGIANETYSNGMNFKEFSSYVDSKLKLAEPPKDEKINYVMHLTPENFNQSVSKGIVFVKFNLLGCSHCIVLDDDWKKAAEMVSKIEGVTLAEIECKNCYGFCLTQRAKGFPTLNVYKEGVMVKYDYHEVMNYQGFYDCAMAYHIGGKHLDEWIEKQKQLRAQRKAMALAMATNGTATNATHH